MQYILKNGMIIESIPIGRSSVKIGEKNKENLLTVCDRGPAPKTGRGATVICECACGNYTWLKLGEFRYGTTKSCGCYGKQQKQILCKELGKKSYCKDYTLKELNKNPYYIYLEPTDENTILGKKWKIKCKKCGQIYYEVPNQLISDKRRQGNNPCNCWRHQSKGILKIINILEQLNINFIQEYTFNSCRSPKNQLLRFDFYLPDYNILIEYDGEQHFQNNGYFGDINAEQKFLQQQEYDNIKNEWCKNNNIKLIRFSYREYKKINKDYLKGVINEQL